MTPENQSIAPKGIESEEAVGKQPAGETLDEMDRTIARAQAALGMTSSPQMSFTAQWPSSPGWVWGTAKLSDDGTYGSPRPVLVKIDYQRGEDDKLIRPLVPIAAEAFTFYDNDGDVAVFSTQAPDERIHFAEPLPTVMHWEEQE